MGGHYHVPLHKYWGDMSPLSHRDRRPCCYDIGYSPTILRGLIFIIISYRGPTTTYDICYFKTYHVRCGIRYLARSANLPTGLYILLALLIFLFLVITRRTVISWSTGPIVTIFQPNDNYLYVDDRSGPFFPIPKGTLSWQPILGQNLGRPLHYRFIWQSGVAKRIKILPFRLKKCLMAICCLNPVQVLWKSIE